MTARLRKIVGWAAVILLPIAYVVGSEVYYARSISPQGVSTVRDFFDRFGEPRRVRMVQRDGQSYYEFTGRLPSGLVLATPSAPPVYVFDEQGRFAAWCRDPGDIHSYRQTWPLQSTNQVEIGLVRERFGLRWEYQCAANPAIASLFHAARPWRGVGEPGHWPHDSRRSN